MEALRQALATPGRPPVLMLLSKDGQFIGDACAELAATRREVGGVVVLLGDDRGLTDAEERSVLQMASSRGSDVRRISLGADMLFASHSIVLVPMPHAACP